MKHITAEALTKEQYSCYNVWSGSPDNCVDGWELKMTNTASPAATREEAEVIPPPNASINFVKARVRGEREAAGEMQDRLLLLLH